MCNFLIFKLFNIGKFFVEKDGAFSYYPKAEHATLDGSDGFFIFNEIGAFSPAKQFKLWGNPQKNIKDLGTIEIREISPKNLDYIKKYENVNSLRFYSEPVNFNQLNSAAIAFFTRKKVRC